ncbi:SOS response-associated peptidase family protein [Kribbella sp. NPDC050281]|uniref:SOS response-associated peptidase family protein n=1 Tax=Kribbella sp. NPDC050281 TaxID=3155515 RepID=UPI0033EBF1EF
MCGRYASVASRAELLERFVVDKSNADELCGQDFNVTPTKDNPVVVARVPQGAGEDADPARELRTFRWGFSRTTQRTSQAPVDLGIPTVDA